MMLKRSTTESKPTAKARLVRAGIASLAVASAIATLATGCLDRPVVKAEPKTSNLFVDQIVQTAVDKIDLLFMIDNSVSMSDKQAILKSAVPLLVTRLVTPICLDGTGKPTGTNADANGQCPVNSSPEFAAIGDIHIGIVSSSLGSHGGSVCATADGADGHPDDKAHLIPTVRTPVVASWNDQGFLAWDHTGKANKPPGVSDPGTLNTQFSNMIGAIGEHGCGYEASLESWYRFLVDPEPPDTVTLQSPAGQSPYTLRSSKLTVGADGKVALDAQGKPVCVGCDTTLLAQRAAFLRPDSLVAIVMLSDENDCSIQDAGVGWFVGSSGRMPLSTSVCDTDPNSPCCRSCAVNETTAPEGCGPLLEDAKCKNPPTTNPRYNTWEPNRDNLNLRCYNQHQRFGFDLLYSTNRYVNALNQRTIQLDSNPNVTVTNPLYDNAGSDKAPRDTSLVFLAGIVGVPWQDIADADSLTGPGLNYLTAKELNAPDADGHTRWDYLLGSPFARPVVAPLDPFMRESIAERSGTNTLAVPPVSIAPANSMNPKANVINGHEQVIPDNQDDLQYACTFPLQMTRDCAENDSACDCSAAKGGKTDALLAANSPLCQPPGGGPASTTQYSAKAYPGARELQVLKDFGDNAIVASICPKITDPANADYGYNPAVGAIIERLKEALKGKCLPRPLEVDDQGQVLCKVIEAQKANCNCDPNEGRGPADPQILAAVRAQLQETGNCGNTGQASCDSWCECEIIQETRDNLKACQGASGGIPAGYCYVDANAKNGATAAQSAEIDSALLKCPANQQQLLRFVQGPSGSPTPAQGSVAFIACLGAPVGSGSAAVAGGAGM